MLLQKLNKFDIYRHCDFEVNPNINDLSKGINIAKSFNPDVIVGIGGGSVMDTAKLIAKFLDADVDLNDCVLKNKSFSKRNKQLFLVPTTAGSGSECTHFAVIYVDDEKYSYASEYLLPDAIVLDSSLTDSVPKSLTAITAFDAFSQAVEAYWSVGSNNQSRAFAKRSIEIIMEVFERLVNAPSEDLRDKMLKASYYAGQAINISKTTAPHAISYFLTKKYNLPHGHAVILTLPIFLEYNAPSCSSNLNPKLDKKEYELRYKELIKLLGNDSLEKAVLNVKNMIAISGLKSSFSQVGLKGINDLEEVARSVNIERLKNNPMLLTQADIIFLLKKNY
jgi:alcohol dehydrogenase class IV